MINLSWIALAFNLFSGFSLFMSNASNYMEDMSFIAKMLFVIIASVATWQLQKELKANAAQWDSSGAISARGYQIALAVLVLYSFTVVIARLIAYL